MSILEGPWNIDFFGQTNLTKADKGGATTLTHSLPFFFYLIQGNKIKIRTIGCLQRPKNGYGVKFELLTIHQYRDMCKKKVDPYI